jgi:hypothetical protein
MPRFFTRSDAELLLPRVKQSLEVAMALKMELQKAEQSLQGAVQRITLAGGSLMDPEKMSLMRRRRDWSARQLRTALEQIQETGCQVKDLDVGLLDFPTRYRGAEVLLCWRFGEDRIDFWHGLEEGFGGRKPIDQDFLAHHHGDTDS